MELIISTLFIPPSSCLSSLPSPSLSHYPLYAPGLPQKRLGDIAIESGCFTTDSLEAATLNDLFDELEAVPAPSVAKKDAPTASMMQMAMDAAEDDGDRRAALGIQAEMSADMREFDENALRETDNDEGGDGDDSGGGGGGGGGGGVDGVLAAGASLSQPERSTQTVAHRRRGEVARRDTGIPTVDDAGEMPSGEGLAVGIPQEAHGRVQELEVSGSHVGEAGEDVSEESQLAAHLSRLQGIDRHSLNILERFLAPTHEVQLNEAHEAVEAREVQLKLMRERISLQVARMVSDDEEQLFYNRDEAYHIYMQGTAASLEQAEVEKEGAGQAGEGNGQGAVHESAGGPVRSAISNGPFNPTPISLKSASAFSMNCSYASSAASMASKIMPVASSHHPLKAQSGPVDLSPIYGPPQSLASLYVDPGHLAMYRVGLVAFVPHRSKRKRAGEERAPLKIKLPRAVLPLSANSSGNAPGAAQNGAAPMSKHDDSKMGGLSHIPDNTPLPSAARVSLFKRKEDLKAGQ